MLRIMWIDPGGTTGWATFTAEEMYDPFDKVTRYHKPKFECGQIADDKHEHHQELYNFIGMQQTDHFILGSESFEFRNTSRTGTELISNEYIGVAKLFVAERMPGKRLLLQTASEGKVRNKPTAFVKPRNLEKLGLWTPGWDHAMDGYGHLLYYMIKHKVMHHELLEKGWKGK